MGIDGDRVVLGLVGGHEPEIGNMDKGIVKGSKDSGDAKNEFTW